MRSQAVQSAIINCTIQAPESRLKLGDLEKSPNFVQCENCHPAMGCRSRRYRTLFPLSPNAPYQIQTNLIFDRLASKRYPLTGRKCF
jgi:hypothetical protein